MASWHDGDHAPELLVYKMELIFFLLIIPSAHQLSFNFPRFKQGDVKLDGDASLLRSEIYVTVSAWDQKSNYSVGRVTSFQQMHLWDKNSRNLTDFSTNFSFIIHSQTNLFGDGLTIFFADPNLPLVKKVKKGGGLGLVDGDQVLHSKHPFVAVEFDTYKNSWDPVDRPHVGLNVNSMNSSVLNRWSDSIGNRDTYRCSIQYNSSTHNFSISYTRYDSNYEQVRWRHLSYEVDLREYLPEWVIVGFSAATGDLFEVHTLQSWSFSSSLLESQASSPASSPTSNNNHVSPASSPTSNNNHISPTSSPTSNDDHVVLFVGIAIGVTIIVGFIGLVLMLFWRRKKMGGKEVSDSDLNMDDEFQKGSGPKKFIHDDLVTATNNFSESEKLGHGGFGSVYKGFLKEQNSYVAIKRISKESKQGKKEYATEVTIISQLRHKNLVQLIGWCHKKKDLLLIYEYMPNGSLDSHLYCGKSFLTWQVRYNIALDLASALLYLHEGREQCVLHRDIKSSNIMLDSNFNAKIGDFGLARMVDHDKGSEITLMAGTMGYIAPECLTTGKASKESDMYSFGVVLLEIASGKKPIGLILNESQKSIIEWVWELYGSGRLLDVADPKLSAVFDEQQMERLVVVGIWCAHPDHSSRPSITQVIQVLKFKAPLPFLPQKMPVPTFLPSTVNSMFSLASSSTVLCEC
ncbi:L-type lectin-domain containing receptor kinase IX.1-like [Prosopis cineraria]|uniref:L-type lectin-domain containing receptor kinase IX.1-like n=1 Tax=Prosopis cineraria TaxID=364024 RepID=UPI00240F802B|nr:L-type lectin-domain containing receptor kinase IX.1-like [Prosopis cineraria]